MQGIRHSVSNFINKNEQLLINKDFRRSASRKVIFSKPSVARKSFIRHQSTFINQLPKRKITKDVKERDNEKINKEIQTMTFIDKKKTFRYNNLNLIIKNLVIKQELNKIKRGPKRNSFFKRKVGTRHFYLIRKQINQRLKNKYKSPYMDYLIEKGYYEHYKRGDYPKYYNFYMINYLINNKRCKLTLRYYDNLYYYNHQEYLIRYFNRNEIFIIMNYVLYFIYDKDIHSVNKYKKKIISDKEIVNMFNNLIKNNYNFLGTMEIFEDVAVYYRNAVVGTSNISRIFCNLEKVKPIFDEEIHYIYAKDVPTLLFPNSVPNFFPLEGIMFDYIKQFIRIRKFKKLKVNNIIDKDKYIINPILRKSGKNFFKKLNSKKNIKNDNNILMNLSLSLSKENNINDKQTESEENKNLHNSKRRLKIDNDIYDVETLVDKILNGYYGNKLNNLKNKNFKKIIPKTKIKNEKIYHRRAQRFKTMQIMNILNSQKKVLLSQKQFIKNKNIDNIDSLNEIKNKKDSIFKTSLRGKNNKYIKINEPKEKTYSTTRQIKFTKNTLSPKINNIKELILKNKEESDFPSPNTQLNILKFNPKNIGLSENNDEKNDSTKKIINFKEYNNKDNNIPNNNLEYKLILSTRRNSRNLKRDNSSTKSIFNFNDKNINSPIREVSSNSSSQKIFFFKFKDTSKFFSNSTKNRYTVNKYISLKKINNVSRNNIHNIQKNKKFNKILTQKAFSTFSGINFDEKVVNVWENNKIEGVTVKDVQKTNNLFTKIKKFNIKNDNTFNEIIKCPNIYISNLG